MQRTLRYLIPSILILTLFGVRSAAAANIKCLPLAGQYICSILPQPKPRFAPPEAIQDNFIMDTSYVRLADYADIYTEPTRSSSIIRNAGDGYLFSSVAGKFRNDAGELWIMINPGEWVHVDDTTVETKATEFRGIRVLENPVRPFGWVVSRNFVPSSEPGGEEDPQFAEMLRYDFVEIYDAVEDKEGWLWYSMGDGRWVKQTHLSIVERDPRPAEVGEDEFWVEVDLYEQTLAAYEGDNMVFATLISSGLNRWPTYEGIFQVEQRFRAAKMSGAEGRVDYYYVEDVPHTMYFDMVNQIALHGAYWHDRFGYKHSHGCVNMPPQDSEWVYQWSAEAENDLWVWVHTSDPQHYFTRYDQEESFAGP
ncbi:MAG: L,D-transpeptidase [Ardenticatenaceae bacterium]|nr:L,D-transpeptidase [Ardenticatenaceae bacterium]